MTPQEQQRIIGYYIEDAKSHLKTIEEYLVNLEDSNECFFEVKVDSSTGAIGFLPAMLEIDKKSTGKAIHEIASYLRISFHSFEIFGAIKPDQKLKDLFQQVFYALKELVEQLEEVSEATDAKAVEIISNLKPIQKELNAHLSLLRHQARYGGKGKDTARPHSVRESAIANHGSVAAEHLEELGKIEADRGDDTSSVDDLRSLIDHLLIDTSSNSHPSTLP
ncbi:MAG TPA: hypothetical protein DEG17_15800 [Cyanobacteria bacterium UBA11149]|nr:hypothetical protein [Cyanobacteria bacterium UBA11367]HBE60981.1 hypothetical protein [Cyanobacteria bacterium UBA11366]HBK65877.1 hypothetical protein [Cyanobacteria bacterium UBA11166]HBR72451.1 hypothetical protein [Cyanobacteria bacterium UBA11159]HBS69398.1 hypothetical protein [Cyanobacteria bacterium UBA11153]HBW90294.1 hypothetical protein [Cyanobacteria bacterium UBA11149]HCA94223.1 hypothetical protein [Cyanobacteria bacterium UBA9226]